MLQEKIDQRDLVGQVDPRHPLSPIAQRAAQAQTERQVHAFEQTTLTGQHQTGTQQHHPQAQRLGSPRTVFPGRAQLAGKVLGGATTVLIEFLLATTAVPAHRRAGQEQRRTLAPRGQPLDQLIGKLHPAGQQLGLAPARPQTIGNRRPRQVDDGIQRLLTQFLQASDTAYLCTAQRGNLLGAAAPYAQLMPGRQPVAAQCPANQASPSGKQNVHDDASSGNGLLTSSIDDRPAKTCTE